MDATDIPQDEEEGGQLFAMSKTEIMELVRGEVVVSLLNQDWLKDKKIISHLNAAVEENMSRVEAKVEGNLNSMVEEKIEKVEEKMDRIDRKFEDQGQETRQLMRSKMDKPISTSSLNNQPQNNALPPTSHHNNRSITNLFNRSSSDDMPHDTFSLMMISTPYTKSWWYGVFIFVFQMILCTLIAINQIKQSIDSSIFNVPFHVNIEVRLGQLMSIIFCVSVQSDVLVSIHTLTLLWKTTQWDKAILDSGDNEDGDMYTSDDEGDASTYKWVLRILLPNLMKFVEGILVLYVSFVVIVQSNNIIDLLRDFTALMIVSEFDNLGFRLAAFGYIGNELYHHAVRVKDITTLCERSDHPLPSDNSLDEDQKCNSFVFRPLILATISLCMIGGWLRIVVQQVRGEIFYQRFPACLGVTPELAKEHFGDGKCYGGKMNTLGCEFEGGDCINFNLEYPLCRGDNLVDVEVELSNDACNTVFAIEACGFDNATCCSSEYTGSITFGDGVCNFDEDIGSNTKECAYENGDCLEHNDMYCSDENGCCPLTVVNGTTFANGICNGGHSATSKCKFDGTDCNDFNNAYSSCPFDDLSVINGSEDVIIGDKVCDGGVYSREECGWEFDDCAVGQIGQDLLEFGGIATGGTTSTNVDTNIKMSGDGSTLAVGMPVTVENGNYSDDASGHVQLFRYHSTKSLWMRLDIDLVGESNGDRFGASIAMSMNGARLAIGAPSNNINEFRSGQVKVFDIYFSSSQSTCIQVGQTIFGESVFDRAGSNIDLSADGSRLAIATPKNAGKIRIFDLHDTSSLSNPQTMEWVQVGQILGRPIENIGLYSLHLSPSNGSVVMFSVGTSNKRLYAIGTTGTDSNITAIQIGNDISSPFSSDIFYRLPTTAAMSGDGSRIAIASNVFNPNGPGMVQVYDYNVATNKFDSIGLEGPIVSSQNTTANGFGYSVALSIDGNMLAISSVKPDCDGNSNFCATGAIELFAYDRAAIPNLKYRSDNVIKEKKGVRRDSSVFGMQLSLAENIDINDASTSTWLSVQSYNFDTEKGYVKVYNLSEQFYPKCEVGYPSSNNIGDGKCNDNSLYNIEECGWDGGDCALYNSLIDCTVGAPVFIGNGICDNFSPYNTEKCGWDGGDCPPAP